MIKRKPHLDAPVAPGSQSGFTLVELMVSIAIGLLILLGLIAVFLNVSRTNAEMAKTNVQIENGRFAIQLLQADLVHAGFWGTYVPQFDNLILTIAPTDAPTAVPDPCLDFSAANWTTAYKTNLIGIPVQTVPSGNCTAVVTNQKPNTDAVVVRHAETCVPGEGNCAATTPGALYFQSSLCSAAAQIGSTATTIKLAPGASSTDNAFVNMTIRLLSGTGGGQTRTITAYDGSTKVATVNTAWVTTPDSSTNYTLDGVDYVLDTGGFTLTKRDCSTTSETRKFISNIYYIRDYAVTAGDGVPTLVRSQFDLVGTTLKHSDPVALIEGIEGFRVEYGIDNVSDSGAAVDYTAAVAWANPTDQRSPTNRGDGNADGPFVRCPATNTTGSAVAPSTYPAAAVCTAAQLTNVAAVNVYVLARSREITPGYTDAKTYALGSTKLGPFNDSYKRHLFSTSVRLTNVSGRRETP
jgi:prepilin-type N-terminal cleavage/methylation domain-containing protein